MSHMIATCSSVTEEGWLTGALAIFMARSEGKEGSGICTKSCCVPGMVQALPQDPWVCAGADLATRKF